MDSTHVRRLLADKLRDAETYWIAAVVGTLINAYGHLLVPWIRGAADPWAAFVVEFRTHPALTVFSVMLAYAFPLAVGVISSVLTRYKNRRIESVADFPERKPDPVFRATQRGRPVEVGANTQQMFDKFEIDSAQKILGEEVWRQIIDDRHGAVRTKCEGVDLARPATDGLRFAAARIDEEDLPFGATGGEALGPGGVEGDARDQVVARREGRLGILVRGPRELNSASDSA